MPPDLEAIKTRVLDTWAAQWRSRPNGASFHSAAALGTGSADPRTAYVNASLDAVAEAPASPEGLTVGHAVEADGSLRIALRLSSDRASDLNWAKRSAAAIRTQGIETDIRVIPQPTILTPAGRFDLGAAGPMAQLRGEYRPLSIGSSISHEKGPAGTLGAFVAFADNSIGVLSCSHVIALGGEAEVGDPICQPAQQDQDLAIADHRIGTLSGKFAPLIAGKSNNLDAAVAALNADLAKADLCNRVPDYNIVGENCIPRNHVGKVLLPMVSASDLRSGSLVGKIGRSSGFTQGRLTYAGLRNFSARFTRGQVEATYTFPDVIEIESTDANQPFAKPGDSGALVFSFPDLRPLGLHFCSVPIAGQPSLNYLMPMVRICAMLHVRLV